MGLPNDKGDMQESRTLEAEEAAMTEDAVILWLSSSVSPKLKMHFQWWLQGSSEVIL